jgi:hypothetical protein
MLYGMSLRPLDTKTNLKSGYARNEAKPTTTQNKEEMPIKVISNAIGGVNKGTGILGAVGGLFGGGKKEKLTSSEKFEQRGFTKTFFSKLETWKAGRPGQYGSDFQYFLKQFELLEGVSIPFGGGEPRQSPRKTAQGTGEVIGAVLNKQQATGKENESVTQTLTADRGGAGGSNLPLIIGAALAAFLLLKK